MPGLLVRGRTPRADKGSEAGQWPPVVWGVRPFLLEHGYGRMAELMWPATGALYDGEEGRKVLHRAWWQLPELGWASPIDTGRLFAYPAA